MFKKIQLLERKDDNKNNLIIDLKFLKSNFLLFLEQQIKHFNKNFIAIKKYLTKTNIKIEIQRNN